MSAASIPLGPIAARMVGRDRAQQGIRQRGYHAAYRQGEANTCPGCGRGHWLVGRQLAECAFCGTALPIEAGAASGPGVFHRRTAPAAQLAPLGTIPNGKD
jgi:hypothetical protein